jgi:hypothetical protein
MNKKRLIGYLFVMVSAFMRRRKKYLHRNISYGMTVPHRYGPKLYPWETGVWGQWYMERRE